MNFLKLLTAGLLLVSCSAIAAKPDPAECPCFDVVGEPPGGMVQALAEHRCTATISSGKRRDRDGDLIREFEVTEYDGGACTRIELQKKSGNNGCQVQIATTVVEEQGTGCFVSSHLIINQISDSQLKSCNAAMREIKKEAAALPDC